MPVPAIDVTIGSGPIGFAERTTRDFLTGGVGLEARFGFRWGWRLTYELAYIGSLHGIAEPLPEGALFGVATEGDMRVNLTSAGLQPYFVFGLGGTYYHVTDWRANTMMSIVAYVAHVPIGVGVGYRIGRMIVDLRGVYRFATDASLLAGGRVSGRYALDTWNLTFGMGFEL